MGGGDSGGYLESLGGLDNTGVSGGIEVLARMVIFFTLSLGKP